MALMTETDQKTARQAGAVTTPGYAVFNGHRRVPPPVNEPIRTYAPGSPERAELKARLTAMAGEKIDIPLIIGGREIRTGTTARSVMPHDHRHVLADYHKASPRTRAAGDRRRARRAARVGQAGRGKIAPPCSCKAAELLADHLARTLNAATMLGQSKTVFQAEIDAACEMIDFWRFNAHFAQELYDEQPISDHGVWNQMDYRPLEGFVYAVSPFNFTAIGGNLPTAPGADGQHRHLEAGIERDAERYYMMKLLEAAGLPPGVINFVAGDSAQISDAARSRPRPRRRALHRQHRRLQRACGRRSARRCRVPVVSADRRRNGRQGLHRRAPVGRSARRSPSRSSAAASNTRGRSAPRRAASTCRGRSGPRCATAPSAMMRRDQDGRRRRLPQLHGRRDRQEGVRQDQRLPRRREEEREDRCTGGTATASDGYFIEPTLVETERSRLPAALRGDLRSGGDGVRLRRRRVGETRSTSSTRTSPYALTGAVFAQIASRFVEATTALRNAAGNFYINDKPTGAVVGQQPFGGARGSGTNDKAGSKLNLVRWVSARTIKETFAPPTDFRYPFMGAE